MDVVIDKSYLQSSSKEFIVKLCDRHRVMMSDILFYELLTTDEEARQRCFAKIPNIENPLVLIPNIGTLLRFENEIRQSSVPIYKRRLNIQFKFNENLASGEFEFTDGQRQIREDQIREVEEDTESFIERVESLKDMFSELSNCEQKNIPKVVEVLKRSVATNHKLIKEIYGGTIDNANYPINVNPECIGSMWVIYRWLQVQLIYSLDLYRKYQGKIPEDIGGKFREKMEHDMLDSHYIVLGILSGALASQDKNIINMYKFLNPKGILIT